MVRDSEMAIVRELFVGKRGRLKAYIFEIATATAYLLIGLTNLIAPSSLVNSSVGRVIHPYDTEWSTLYLLGGAAVLVGVLLPQLRLRVAGLLLLGTGLLMQTVASASFQLQPRVLAPLVYAIACLTRAYLVTKLFVCLRGANRDEAQSDQDQGVIQDAL